MNKELDKFMAEKVMGKDYIFTGMGHPLEHQRGVIIWERGTCLLNSRWEVWEPSAPDGMNQAMMCFHKIFTVKDCLNYKGIPRMRKFINALSALNNWSQAGFWGTLPGGKKYAENIDERSFIRLMLSEPPVICQALKEALE